MLRHIIIIIISLMTVSCASKANIEKYNKDLDDIRNEVRNIRKIADDMKGELTSLKKSVQNAGLDINRQTEEIESQKEHQEKLNKVLSNLKDAVVKLESEKLPARREEFEKYAKENSDDSGFGFIVEKRGEVNELKSVELPDGDLPPKKEKKVKKDIKVKAGSGFGYAVKDGVILWGRPSKNSDVLEILVSWQQLMLTGQVRSENIDWWKVKTTDYEGFVNSKFVIISD